MNEVDLSIGIAPSPPKAKSLSTAISAARDPNATSRSAISFWFECPSMNKEALELDPTCTTLFEVSNTVETPPKKPSHQRTATGSILWSSVKDSDEDDDLLPTTKVSSPSPSPTTSSLEAGIRTIPDLWRWFHATEPWWSFKECPEGSQVHVFRSGFEPSLEGNPDGALLKIFVVEPSGAVPQLNAKTSPPLQQLWASVVALIACATNSASTHEHLAPAKQDRRGWSASPPPATKVTAKTAESTFPFECNIIGATCKADGITLWIRNVIEQPTIDTEPTTPIPISTPPVRSPTTQKERIAAELELSFNTAAEKQRLEAQAKKAEASRRANRKDMELVCSDCVWRATSRSQLEDALRDLLCPTLNSKFPGFSLQFSISSNMALMRKAQNERRRSSRGSGGGHSRRGSSRRRESDQWMQERSSGEQPVATQPVRAVADVSQAGRVRGHNRIAAKSMPITPIHHEDPISTSTPAAPVTPVVVDTSAALKRAFGGGHSRTASANAAESPGRSPGISPPLRSQNMPPPPFSVATQLPAQQTFQAPPPHYSSEHHSPTVGYGPGDYGGNAMSYAAPPTYNETVSRLNRVPEVHLPFAPQSPIQPVVSPSLSAPQRGLHNRTMSESAARPVEPNALTVPTRQHKRSTSQPLPSQESPEKPVMLETVTHARRPSTQSAHSNTSSTERQNHKRSESALTGTTVGGTSTETGSAKPFKKTRRGTRGGKAVQAKKEELKKEQDERQGASGSATRTSSLHNITDDNDSQGTVERTDVGNMDDLEEMERHQQQNSPESPKFSRRSARSPPPASGNGSFDGSIRSALASSSTAPPSRPGNGRSHRRGVSWSDQQSPAVQNPVLSHDNSDEPKMELNSTAEFREEPSVSQLNRRGQPRDEVSAQNVEAAKQIMIHGVTDWAADSVGERFYADPDEEDEQA